MVATTSKTPRPNGVFLNTVDNRLLKGELYLLRNGDRLLIDDMEIAVALEKAAAWRRAIAAGGARHG